MFRQPSAGSSAITKSLRYMQYKFSDNGIECLHRFLHKIINMHVYFKIRVDISEYIIPFVLIILWFCTKLLYWQGIPLLLYLSSFLTFCLFSFLKTSASCLFRLHLKLHSSQSLYTWCIIFCKSLLQNDDTEHNVVKTPRFGGCLYHCARWKADERHSFGAVR